MTVPTSPPMYSTSICWVLSCFFFLFLFCFCFFGWGERVCLHFASSIYWILCTLLVYAGSCLVFFVFFVLVLVFFWLGGEGLSPFRFQYILDLVYSTSICWVLSCLFFLFFVFFGWGEGGCLHFASSIYWILCYVWHPLLAVPISLPVFTSSIYWILFLNIPLFWVVSISLPMFASSIYWILCLNIPFGCPCFISSVHFQYILDLVSFLSIPSGSPHVTSCVHFQCTLSSAHFGTCPLAASTSLPMYTSMI